jgi:hypothetical protein
MVEFAAGWDDFIAGVRARADAGLGSAVEFIDGHFVASNAHFQASQARDQARNELVKLEQFTQANIRRALDSAWMDFPSHHRVLKAANSHGSGLVRLGSGHQLNSGVAFQVIYGPERYCFVFESGGAHAVDLAGVIG